MTAVVQVEKRMGKADICWLHKHKWQQRSSDQVTSLFSPKCDYELINQTQRQMPVKHK